MEPGRNWRRQLLRARIEMESDQSTAAFATLNALKRELERDASPQLRARVDVVHASFLESGGRSRQREFTGNCERQGENPAMRAQSALNAVRLYQHADKFEMGTGIG